MLITKATAQVITAFEQFGVVGQLPSFKGRFPLRVIFLRIRTDRKVSFVISLPERTNVMMTKKTFQSIPIRRKVILSENRPSTSVLMGLSSFMIVKPK